MVPLFLALHALLAIVFCGGCLVLAVIPRHRPTSLRAAAAMLATFPGVFLYQLLCLLLYPVCWLLFLGAVTAADAIVPGAAVAQGVYKSHDAFNVFVLGLMLSSVAGFVSGWRVAWYAMRERSLSAGWRQDFLVRAIVWIGRVLGPSTAGPQGEKPTNPVSAPPRKSNLYALLVGELVFCLLGPPIGAFIFWMLIGVTTSNEGLLRGLMVGIGGSPVAIIFGFIPGIPVSAIIGFVFWKLVAVPRFRSHIRLSGMASAAIVFGVPVLLSVISKISGDPRDVMYALQMGAIWLCTGALTGLIVPPLAWRVMKKHISDVHDTGATSIPSNNMNVSEGPRDGSQQ